VNRRLCCACEVGVPYLSNKGDPACVVAHSDLRCLTAVSSARCSAETVENGHPSAQLQGQGPVNNSAPTQHTQHVWRFSGPYWQLQQFTRKTKQRQELREPFKNPLGTDEHGETANIDACQHSSADLSASLSLSSSLPPSSLLPSASAPATSIEEASSLDRSTSRIASRSPPVCQTTTKQGRNKTHS